MKIESFPVGLFQCNCTLIIEGNQAIVIDPGGDWDVIEDTLKKEKAEPRWVLHTHAHLDHVGATPDLKDHYTASQICLHQGDQWLVENLHVQAALLNLPFQPIEAIDHWMTDGDAFSLQKQIRIEATHTPGHTPGSMCFLMSVAGQPHTIFSGDTLFQRGIGRTDLWGGDTEQIFQSIHSLIRDWPHEIPVITGHGPSTTLGQEKQLNPFLTGVFR